MEPHITLNDLRDHPEWFGTDVLQRLQSGAALTSGEYVHGSKNSG